MTPSSAPTTLRDEAVAQRMEGEQYKFRDLWDNEMGQTIAPVKHDKTSMIMLCWEPQEDDLGIATEVEVLQRVLGASEYNFNVVVKQLHTRTAPQMQAIKHLAEFVEEEDDERALLIIYYAGHGFREETDVGTIRLCGRDYKNNINWVNVERVLVENKSDVLVIFDCCHAGLLCQRAWRDSTRCFQYIGACEAHDYTPRAGQASFTRALTWAFEQLKTKREGFYANELVSLVREAPGFRKDQFPQLWSGRFETSPEHMFIAPMSKRGEASTQAVGEYRDQRDSYVHAFVDLRFNFEESVTEGQLKQIAQKMRHWVSSHQALVSCQGIGFLQSGTKEQRAAAKRWNDVAKAVRTRAFSFSSPITPVARVTAPKLETKTLVCPSENTQLLGPPVRAIDCKALPNETVEGTLGYHLQAAAIQILVGMGGVWWRLLEMLRGSVSRM